MIQRKLSKAQGYAVQVLAMQLTQLQAQIGETQEALNEQAELLRARFGLPEGEAQFGQGPDGWTLAVTSAATKPASVAIPSPTPEEAKELAEITETEVEMLEGMTPVEARVAVTRSPRGRRDENDA